MADLEVLAEDARAADEMIERLERAGVPDEDELVSLVAGFRGVVMQLVDEGRIRGVTCTARGRT